MTIGISDVTWEVLVDWDMTDWAAVPDFSQLEDDISADVQWVGFVRGKDKEGGNAPAAIFEVKLKPGLCLKYSPVNTAGVLYGRLLPWRAIRARAYYDGNYYDKFAGFISKYSLTPGANSGTGAVSIYCTDGVDLLARQLITADYDNKGQMTEADAVGAVLDAAGWPAGKRNLDTGAMVNYPAVTEY
jgi:hypothetical protein